MVYSARTPVNLKGNDFIRLLEMTCWVKVVAKMAGKLKGVLEKAAPVQILSAEHTFANLCLLFIIMLS